MAAAVNDDHNHVVAAIMEAQNISVQYSTYYCFQDQMQAHHNFFENSCF
jgi:hypothetical protein